MAERKKIDIDIRSAVLRVGEADVSLRVVPRDGVPTLLAEVSNLNPLVLDINESRDRKRSFFAFDLAHRVVYYAVTGHEAPKGDFDYGTFAVNSMHLLRLIDTIRTLVQAYELDGENAGHRIIGCHDQRR
jgi:hypothetical protein